MKPVVVSRDIDADPTRIWECLTDLDQVPRWSSAITRLERVSGPGFDVGTRWRETRTIMTRETTEEMWVTAVEPGRAYTVEAGERGTHYRSEVSLQTTGKRARVTMSFQAIPGSVVTKTLATMVGWMVTGATRSALAQDLADLAAALETG